MNNLFFLIPLLILGCSESNPCKGDLEKCQLIKTGWSLRSLDTSCAKLAKCMDMNYEILHFPNQSHNPYACSISKTEDGYTRSNYYYPTGRISFGEVIFDHLENAIDTCEMITKTGDKSKVYYKELNDLFDKMDKERSKKAVRPTPEPDIKVRVVE